MPNVMKRFARTVEILQGNDGDQFVVGADVNANRLHGIAELGFDSEVCFWNHFRPLMPIRSQIIA
jgi:hypothetical protein